MKNIDVLFLIEHVDRELDAVTCVMEKLRSKMDIRSDVRSYYHDFFYTLDRYNPKVVVFPFFYGADHVFPISYFERWPNACFVNMGWEQILVNLDVQMKMPRDEITRKRINHLCWTRQHRDFLAGHSVTPDNLHITGNPVMKFYEYPYRKYFKSREELAQKYGLDPKRKWVLFPENYFLAFITDAGLESLALHQNANREYLKQARTYCNQSLKQFFVWSKALDRKNDPILILRPRPISTREQMIDFMHQVIGDQGKSIRIIKAETAREWILASDHVISSHSTTLIEAALAGKSVHMFAPEPLPEALKSEWHRFVPSLRDPDSFLDATRRTDITRNGTAVGEWARAELLPVGDPLDAIAEVVAGHLGISALKVHSHIPDHQCLGTGRIFVERIRKFIQHRPVLHKFFSGYRFGRNSLAFDDVFRADNDIFGADDVAARISRWREVLKFG